MSLPTLKLPFTFNVLHTGTFLITLVLSFSPLIEGGTTYYPVATIQILILILLIFGFSYFFYGGPYISLKSPPFYSILLFLTYLITLSFFSPYKYPAFQQVQLFVFYFILFYFSIFFNLNYAQFKEKVIRLLLAMGVFEAMFGLFQYFIFHQRAKGTFFNPDFFGEYLAIIFCIALGLFFEDFKNRLHRWSMIGVLILIGGGIVLSQSRGAALAWAAGSSIVLWKRFRYKMVYVLLILIIFLFIIPNPLQHRFLYDYREDPYSLSRIEMWKEAARIIKDRPFGIGSEMFPFISPRYSFPINLGTQHYSKVAESPHNEYLRLFTELGIQGGLLFLGGLFLFYFKWRDKTDQSFLRSGIFGGTAVFFTHSLVDSNFHEPALVITLIVLSTLLLDKKLFQFSILAKSEKLKVKSPFTFYLSLFILGLLAIKPAIGWFCYNKGYEQIRENRNQDAVASIRTALLFEKQNARYHQTLANAYFNIFRATNNKEWIIKSLDELDSALELNPVDGNYFKIKGSIYKNLAMKVRNREEGEKFYNEAFTNFKNAIKLFPYDASVYLEIGDIHSYFQRFGEAETAYHQAITLEPNYLLAREKKIELLLKIGRREEAFKEYQNLLSAYEQIRSRAASDLDKAFIYFNQEKLRIAFEGLE